MRIQVGEADQKLLGLPEWVEFDPRDISVADLEELADRFDFDPSEWPEPYFGELTIDQAGDPNAKPKPPRWQNRATAWMILRQNDVNVSWEAAGVMRLHRAQTEPSPGKDPTGLGEPSTTTPSPSSSTSTESTSTD